MKPNQVHGTQILLLDTLSLDTLLHGLQFVYKIERAKNQSDSRILL